MAESKTNRADASRESGSAVASRERERDYSGLQRRPAGGWLSSPWEVMNRMTEEMDQMFGRVFRDFGGVPRRSWSMRQPSRSLGSFGQHGLWSPRVEAFQQGDRFIVRAELPGLKKDDVHVEIHDDALTIHGERREEHEEEREGYFHTEREYGEFHRNVPLPDGVIAESAQATFKNGVLEISMQAPPSEATRGRRVEIKDAPADDKNERNERK